MLPNKTINNIRFAHWEKSSLALRAKALGFSRYNKINKTPTLILHLTQLEASFCLVQKTGRVSYGNCKKATSKFG
tara:strand:+ start:299 stop:523 length:225 start_codon:yes stop_codon:yes gene_type:complete